MLPSLIVVNVWKEFPFAMIMMLAGLQTVPEQLHRAAHVDGAGPWHRFWHVTMPHLKGVSAGDGAVAAGGQPQQLHHSLDHDRRRSGRRLRIWITAIYEIAFGRMRFGIASAYSVILFVVMMALGYFYVRALTPARTRCGDEGASRRRGDGWLVARILFLTLLAIFTLLPMVWMVLTSIKTQFAALQYPPEWFRATSLSRNIPRCSRPPARSGVSF